MSEFRLGKIEFLFKRKTDDPRYVYSKYEESDSLICEFVNTSVTLNYLDIPRPVISEYMELSYLIKNKKPRGELYTVTVGKKFFYAKNCRGQ